MKARQTARIAPAQGEKEKEKTRDTYSYVRSIQSLLLVKLLTAHQTERSQHLIKTQAKVTEIDRSTYEVTYVRTLAFNEWVAPPLRPSHVDIATATARGSSEDRYRT